MYTRWVPKDAAISAAYQRHEIAVAKGYRLIYPPPPVEEVDPAVFTRNAAAAERMRGTLATLIAASPSRPSPGGAAAAAAATTPPPASPPARHLPGARPELGAQLVAAGMRSRGGGSSDCKSPSRGGGGKTAASDSELSDDDGGDDGDDEVELDISRRAGGGGRAAGALVSTPLVASTAAAAAAAAASREGKEAASDGDSDSDSDGGIDYAAELGEDDGVEGDGKEAGEAGGGGSGEEDSDDGGALDGDAGSGAGSKSATTRPPSAVLRPSPLPLVAATTTATATSAAAAATAPVVAPGDCVSVLAPVVGGVPAPYAVPWDASGDDLATRSRQYLIYRAVAEELVGAEERAGLSVGRRAADTASVSSAAIIAAAIQSVLRDGTLGSGAAAPTAAAAVGRPSRPQSGARGRVVAPMTPAAEAAALSDAATLHGFSRMLEAIVTASAATSARAARMPTAAAVAEVRPPPPLTGSPSRPTIVVLSGVRADGSRAVVAESGPTPTLRGTGESPAPRLPVSERLYQNARRPASSAPTSRPASGRPPSAARLRGTTTTVAAAAATTVSGQALPVSVFRTPIGVPAASGVRASTSTAPYPLHPSPSLLSMVEAINAHTSPSQRAVLAQTHSLLAASAVLPRSSSPTRTRPGLPAVISVPGSPATPRDAVPSTREPVVILSTSTSRTTSPTSPLRTSRSTLLPEVSPMRPGATGGAGALVVTNTAAPASAATSDTMRLPPRVVRVGSGRFAAAPPSAVSTVGLRPAATPASTPAAALRTSPIVMSPGITAAMLAEGGGGAGSGVGGGYERDRGGVGGGGGGGGFSVEKSYQAALRAYAGSGSRGRRVSGTSVTSGGSHSATSLVAPAPALAPLATTTTAPPPSRFGVRPLSARPGSRATVATAFSASRVTASTSHLPPS